MAPPVSALLAASGEATPRGSPPAKTGLTAREAPFQGIGDSDGNG